MEEICCDNCCVDHCFKYNGQIDETCYKLNGWKNEDMEEL